MALGGLFFPKRWVSPRSGNSVGSYTPDLGEYVVAACEPCKQAIADDVVARNRMVAANEQKLTPRFMKRESAERIATGRKQGTELRQKLDDKLSGIRERLRAFYVHAAEYQELARKKERLEAMKQAVREKRLA